MNEEEERQCEDMDHPFPPLQAGKAWPGFPGPGSLGSGDPVAVPLTLTGFYHRLDGLHGARGSAFYPSPSRGQFVTLRCIYSQKRVLTEGKGTERPEPQVPNTAELRPGRAGEDSPRADVLALGEHVEVFPVQL